MEVLDLFAQMPRDIAIPYYALRAIQPLESPITAVSLIEAECDLWTACEWLIHNAYAVLECLRYHAIHKEGRALFMGKMYRMDVGDPCSLKRWDWWKHRLEELAADADTEAKQRVAKALASMEAAEAQPSEVEEKEKRKDKGGGDNKDRRDKDGDDKGSNPTLM